MPGDTRTRPLLIPAAQVAEALGVSRTTVWRLVKAGKLAEPVRIGGAVRFRRSDIERFVEDLADKQSEANR